MPARFWATNCQVLEQSRWIAVDGSKARLHVGLRVAVRSTDVEFGGRDAGYPGGRKNAFTSTRSPVMVPAVPCKRTTRFSRSIRSTDLASISRTPDLCSPHGLLVLD